MFALASILGLGGSAAMAVVPSLKRRRGSMGNRGILAIAGIVLSLYIYLQIGLKIGDKFTTSDSLEINETENADGYAAQQQLNTDFYDNVEFLMFLGFIVIVAGAIMVLRWAGFI